LSSNIQCKLMTTCGLYTWTIGVKNQSKEIISSPATSGYRTDRCGSWTLAMVAEAAAMENSVVKQ
jgi:hypothetical protein